MQTPDGAKQLFDARLWDLDGAEVAILGIVVAVEVGSACRDESSRIGGAYQRLSLRLVVPAVVAFQPSEAGCNEGWQSLREVR